jgi:hypothetical protein
LFRLVLESHDGRALVPIPKRSTSPRATSTLVDSLKALDSYRPIREADIDEAQGDAAVAAESLAVDLTLIHIVTRL